MDVGMRSYSLEEPRLNCWCSCFLSKKTWVLFPNDFSLLALKVVGEN